MNRQIWEQRLPLHLFVRKRFLSLVAINSQVFLFHSKENSVALIWAGAMNKFIKDSKGSRQERARHYRLAKALRQFFQIQSIERPPKLNFCYPFGKNLLILAVLEIY